MGENENNPVQEPEEEVTTNEVDYTVYLQDIIDNQNDITDNQTAILTALVEIQTNQERQHNEIKLTYSAVVGLFVLILFIGACKYIKRIL